MPIQIECPDCGHEFRRPDALAGKLEKCPKCRKVLRVPGTAQTWVPPTAPVRRKDRSQADGPPGEPGAPRRPIPGVDPEQENMVGTELLATGNLEAATEKYEIALEAGPDNTGIAFNLAVAYRLAGRFVESENLLEKLLGIDPSDLDAKAEIQACEESDTSGSAEYEAARRAFLTARNPASAESEPPASDPVAQLPPDSAGEPDPDSTHGFFFNEELPGS